MQNTDFSKLSDMKLQSFAVKSGDDKLIFDAILDDQHYLGSRQPAGNTIRQAIADGTGKWVAIALWCGACYRLDPRDTYIGWDRKKREERLGLITQLARFALVDPKHEKNMASYTLGFALKEIGRLHMEAYGYEPALAESFSDPELHEGTIYRATNWEKVGFSKGFSREYRDYYVENGRPKVLWLRWLRKDGEKSVKATVLADKDKPALLPSQLLPFDDEKVESFFEMMLKIRDPRRNNRSICQASVLCACLLARLCGRQTMSEIVRFAQEMTQHQKKLLGFPRLRNHHDICVAPSRKTFDSVMRQIPPEELASMLDEFFAKSLGELPETLAVDGKYVRDKAGTLNTCDVHGRTVSSVPIKKKEKNRPPRAKHS